MVNQYGEQLYWQIRRIVFDHDDANDVLQNTLIKCWTHRDEFQGKSNIKTWLTRIAINEALDFLRKKKREQNFCSESDEGISNQLSSDPYFDGDHTLTLLQEALATLPDVQRTVFTLRYYDEMKYAQMSEVLKTSEGALKASYHLAVKKITEYLKTHD
ncbi:MAG: sigma-70 family RNA polymerase sigma factor [Prevotella sp.]|uniref:RNA polymerase sigma factor n=1 Tax=Prevotella sp. AGR2160 TaxID=1280674 RepID=UPI001E4E9A7A|nr:sigma-70 family RNA polymerase sigma factor [Prevotella sp. AGR2160]MDD5862402.1 sigma-70 family RNA polymerase sigma factor [Prevotella sp.]